MNKHSERYVVRNGYIFSFLQTIVILECLLIIFQLLYHYGGTGQLLVSSSTPRYIKLIQSSIFGSHTL